MDPLKIIRFTASNIKKLVAVEITPEGNVVEITGKNGEGKTTVLNCIAWAIGDKTDIQSTPIRDGEAQGEVVLDMGDYVVKRNFTALDDGDWKTKLTLQTKEGYSVPSPTAFLKRIKGDIAFDPYGFARMKPAEQYAVLRGFVEGFDFDAEERANKEDYDKRRVQNALSKQARARARDIVVETIDGGRIDTQKIRTEINGAQLHNNEQRTRQHRLDQNQSSIDSLTNNRELVQGQIDALQKRQADLTALIDGHTVTRTKIPTPQALTEEEPLRDALQHANDHNGTITANEQRADTRKSAVDEAETAEAKSVALTKAMDDRKASMAKAVAKATFPVDGLTIEDGMAKLNGHALDVASRAEMLTLGFAIAASKKPRLRVALIEDASLMDSNSLRKVAELSVKYGFQTWLERVDESGTVGIVIEDGRVKGQDNDLNSPRAQSNCRSIALRSGLSWPMSTSSGTCRSTRSRSSTLSTRTSRTGRLARNSPDRSTRSSSY